MAVLCSHSITFFKSQFDASQDCTTAAQQSFLIVAGSKLCRQIWNVLNSGPLKPRSFLLLSGRKGSSSAEEGRWWPSSLHMSKSRCFNRGHWMWHRKIVVSEYQRWNLSWTEFIPHTTKCLREAVFHTNHCQHEWSSVQLGCCEGSAPKEVFKFPLPCPSHDSKSTLHWERWWTLQSSVGTRTMTFLHVFWQSVEAKQCVKSTKPIVNGSFVVSGWTKIVSQLGARTGGATKSGIHDVLKTSWSWVLFFVANQVTVHKLKWLSDFAPEIRILNFLPEIFKRIEKSPREDSLGKIGQDN